MKLVRYGPSGQETGSDRRPGPTARPIGPSGVIDGAALSPASLHKLAAIDAASLPAVSGPVRHGPPVARVGKIICVGLNYADHVETGAPIPAEPILFLKPSSSIIGADDTVVIPRGSVKTDWEVELAW